MRDTRRTCSGQSFGVLPVQGDSSSGSGEVNGASASLLLSRESRSLGGHKHGQVAGHGFGPTQVVASWPGEGPEGTWL
jgi:hypothetical protein